jgi:hypothetical protein
MILQIIPCPIQRTLFKLRLLTKLQSVVESKRLINNIHVTGYYLFVAVFHEKKKQKKAKSKTHSVYYCLLLYLTVEIIFCCTSFLSID